VIRDRDRAMASWKQERFVCIGCGGNGNFFLTRKAASVHNARNEKCRGKGIKCITVETRPSDREVGGSGAAGSIPDLRHQAPGID